MSLVPTEVRADAELTAAFVATSAVRSRNAAWIDWAFDLSAQGGVTEIEIDFQTSIEPNDDTEPSAAQWATVQSEDVAAGIAMLNDYVLTKTVGGALRLNALVPALGFFMRARVRSSAGVVAGSIMSAVAIQRGVVVER